MKLKIVFGVKAIMKAVNVENAIIAIENNKPDAIKLLEKASENEANIKVASLKVKYPQGGMKRG